MTHRVNGRRDDISDVSSLRSKNSRNESRCKWIASRATSSSASLRGGLDKAPGLCDARRRPDSSNVSLMAVTARESSCLGSKFPPGKTWDEGNVEDVEPL